MQLGRIFSKLQLHEIKKSQFQGKRSEVHFQDHRHWLQFNS